ncbi:hypothetical protein SAMN05421678_12931 [Actinopolymorpha cephalotaxi]|uniref:Uncharacterized protein n=1 Tax=Actinopolymorpha cephalotaxi TaxID=504797 RepID=A0A1I3C583_9ACTN|nr:hypothetical protein [Actinopolymorpha cephalotaxi]SFH69694.1 hypothetical protein SAMN05421678_12931 [Actinopolymorpha cephalotaxi]
MRSFAVVPEDSHLGAFQPQRDPLTGQPRPDVDLGTG